MKNQRGYMKNAPLLISAAFLALMLSGCTVGHPDGGPNESGVPQANASGNGSAPMPPQSNGSNESGPGGLANPASEFCINNSGTLSIMGGPAGQHGVCTFGNGAQCEEWAFFRGDCGMDNPNYCVLDSDCACGVHATTGACFYGSKEFVDVSRQCPDFCNGIAAHLEIKCLKNRCTQVLKDSCRNYQPDECPEGCAVCPPCPACSSIACQNETYCEDMGFDKGWYEGMVSFG
jgi:putative hemolysin